MNVKLDIQAYIASGVLEAYVLGHASEQEAKAVQCLSKIYPEVREALDVLEADLSTYARAHEVELPAGLKDRIMAEVRNTPQEGATEGTKQVAEPVVRSIAPEPVVATSNSRTMLSWAAAVAAMVALGVTTYYQQQSIQDLQEENVAFQQEVVGMQEILLEQQGVVTSQEQLLVAMANPSNKVIDLQGMAALDGNQTRVYWNPESQQVLWAAEGLPKAPEGKQYQLWALVGGVPVDMGVLPMESDGSVQLMKPTDKADAFAITIEPAGGLPSPSLDQLVFLGQVTS